MSRLTTVARVTCCFAIVVLGKSLFGYPPTDDGIWIPLATIVIVLTFLSWFPSAPNAP
jgi:hypothetical protein